VGAGGASRDEDVGGRIAMMSKRFDKDSEDTHRIWIFPFANLVLRYERMLSVRQQARHRSGIAAAARSPTSPRVPSRFGRAEQGGREEGRDGGREIKDWRV
jgi:hypothetical protein